MNHIETVAHILDQCRIKDAEIEALKSQLKSEFFRGVEFCNEWHGEGRGPDDTQIEEAFLEYEREAK